MIFLLAFAAFAHADSLRCDVASGALSETATSAIVEGQSDAQSNGSGSSKLAFDSSLSPSSVVLVVNDDMRHRRVAFTGSARAISTDGARLESGGMSASCKTVVDGKLSLAPPEAGELPDYFVCLLDEARFENGEIKETKRRAFKTFSPLNTHMAIDLADGKEGGSFQVHYLSYDPFKGLDVTLTDKETGEAAHFVGPARSMGSSFMLGFTIGDRATAARFLRLGCAWTDDPSKFKE
jgi:hypothetical protein